MAHVGLNSGSARALLAWTPPNNADRDAEMLACMDATMDKAAHLDACMEAGGFSFVADQVIPYRSPGQESTKESREHLKHCASDPASLTDRIDHEYGKCLQERGWTWKWLER
jgi:hypothetical protein